jgi:hypothetical protein
MYAIGVLLAFVLASFLTLEWALGYGGTAFIAGLTGTYYLMPSLVCPFGAVVFWLFIEVCEGLCIEP